MKKSIYILAMFMLATIGSAMAQSSTYKDTVDIEIGDSVTIRVMMKDANNMKQVVKVDLNEMMRTLNENMSGVGANMEKFGKDMEKWGEQFAKDMERMATEMGKGMEANTEGAGKPANLEVRKRELESQARDLERQARELERRARDLEMETLKSEAGAANSAESEVEMTAKELEELRAKIGAEEVEVRDYGFVSVTKVTEDGKIYRSAAASAPENTTVITVSGKKNTTEVTVGEDGKTNIVRSKNKSRTSYEFAIDLGLNNYLDNGKIPGSGEPYNLKPLGSRYIAFNLLQNTRLGKEKSPIYLQWGVEFGFNNFMFSDNQVYIKDSPEGPIYITDTLRNISKSKYTASYISIPVMPMLNFAPTKKNGFHIGVGGYVGYRLGSHNKVKYSEEGDTEKDKDRSDFHLNSIRYGVVMNTGVEGIIDVFVKYDLNNLFEKSPGPDLNVISFGIRI